MKLDDLKLYIDTLNLLNNEIVSLYMKGDISKADLLKLYHNNSLSLLEVIRK